MARQFRKTSKSENCKNIYIGIVKKFYKCLKNVRKCAFCGLRSRIDFSQKH